MIIQNLFIKDLYIIYKIYIIHIIYICKYIIKVIKIYARKGNIYVYSICLDIIFFIQVKENINSLF